jgi:hypothetical protein
MLIAQSARDPSDPDQALIDEVVPPTLTVSAAHTSDRILPPETCLVTNIERSSVTPQHFKPRDRRAALIYYAGDSGECDVVTADVFRLYAMRAQPGHPGPEAQSSAFAEQCYLNTTTLGNLHLNREDAVRF